MRLIVTEDMEPLFEVHTILTNLMWLLNFLFICCSCGLRIPTQCCMYVPSFKR